MKKKVRKIKEYQSIEEFNKFFFPETFEDELSKIDDPKTFGIKLAEKSLKIIEKELAKK